MPKIKNSDCDINDALRTVSVKTYENVMIQNVIVANHVQNLAIYVR